MDAQNENHCKSIRNTTSIVDIQWQEDRENSLREEFIPLCGDVSWEVTRVFRHDSLNTACDSRQKSHTGCNQGLYSQVISKVSCSTMDGLKDSKHWISV